MKKHFKISIVLTIFTLFACTPRTVIQTPFAIPTENLFEQAEKNFFQGDYNRAMELYNQYMTDHSGGPYAMRALMREGEIYTLKRDYATARMVYQYMLEQHPNHGLAPEARFAILKTFYEEQDYANLIQQAEFIIKDMSSVSHIMDIYLLMGDSHLAQNAQVSAAWYYAQAQSAKDKADKKRTSAQKTGEPELPKIDKRVRKKLAKTLSKLSLKDIAKLSEKLDHPGIIGYLTYGTGIFHAQEKKYEAAIRLLSDFIETFPGHEDLPAAKVRLEEILNKLQEQSTATSSPDTVADIMARYNQNLVGCLLPLTGKYSTYGNRALNGIQLALSRYEGLNVHPPIRLVIEDTGSDPETAIRKFHAMARKNVSAIIGPIKTAQAVAIEAQKQRIPIITFTQKKDITEIGDYIFRNFMTPKMQVDATVSYAMDVLGIKNFAILYPNEKYGETFMNLFWDKVMSKGGKVVGVESYKPSSTDFAAPIKKLVGRYYSIKTVQRKKKRSIVDFEALFIPDEANKVGLIIPQLAYYDINDIRLFGTNLWHSRRLIKLAGRFADGVVFPDGFFLNTRRQSTLEFIQMYKQTFGQKPGFMEAVAFDSASMIFSILIEKKIRFKSELKNALAHVNNFNGASGLTSFDETGESSKQLFLIRVAGDEFEAVKTD
ncbi:penicillin-binding protein activator [Desulfobacterales bacterium HSG16]|nr:penicillin-binding protein activator [Desulfobacterales bacterium HSG16]